MPVDRRTVGTFFDRKVPGAQRLEGARHVSYRVVSENHTVLLPALTVTRGPAGEDLPLRNLKGLAEDVGMTLEGFIEGSKCRIRAEYVMYCILCRIVCHAMTMHELDGVAFDRNMISALHRSMKQWIDIKVHGVVVNPSKKEVKESVRAYKRVEDTTQSPLFVSMRAWLKQVGDEKLGLPLSS